MSLVEIRGTIHTTYHLLTLCTQAIANIDNNTIHENIDVPLSVNRRGDTPQWGWIDSIDNRLQPRKFGRNGRSGLPGPRHGQAFRARLIEAFGQFSHSDEIET